MAEKKSMNLGMSSGRSLARCSCVWAGRGDGVALGARRFYDGYARA